VLCFQQFAEGDLLIGAAKIVGSAQRRQRGSLMQHGGILLAGSPATPLLPGVEELTGQRIAADALCSAVSQSFAQTTGWDLVTEDWTQVEKQRLVELVRIRYGEDSWNCKR
jgi:lipoate-protein ligase A